MTDSKWDKKLTALRESYPEVRNIDWGKILKDEPEVFRAVAGGVGKSAVPKKSKMNHSTSHQRYAQLTDTDYSELPFVDALHVLWGDKSLNGMVAKTGITKQIIYQMKKGNREPTFEEMEQIARSFGHDPSFFLEYRIGKVLAAIDIYLQTAPETAAVWYNHVTKNTGLKI